MQTKAKIYAVMNRKGGVAKTTTAVTLAQGLAKKIEGQGHVLLIDLDPQGNVAHSLGVSPKEHDIADVLTGRVPVEQAIIHADRSKTDGPTRPNLWLLPASDALAQAKLTLVANTALSSVLAQFGNANNQPNVPVDSLLNTYLAKPALAFAYIIIDCPPSLDMLSSAVYHFADEAIVPVKVDFLGVGGTARHTQNIIDAQASGIDIKIKCIVPTFVRARERLARQMLQALQDSYGASRVALPIPQAAVVEQAPASGGQTVLEYAPDSFAAASYWKLVEKVMHE